MSTMKTCEQGHWYDPSEHTLCPYCSVLKQSTPQRNATVDASSPLTDSTKRSPHLEPNVTRPAAAVRNQPDGLTIGPYSRPNEPAREFEPVVGWLVCIKGPHRGQDFRIRASRNFIGRNPNMDIQIANDPGVSREKHARIGFDPRSNGFTLIPGESGQNVYLKGMAVYAPVPIAEGDLLELGQSTFVFIPFCKADRRWDTSP